MESKIISDQVRCAHQALNQFYEIISKDFLPELDRKLRKTQPGEAERAL